MKEKKLAVTTEDYDYELYLLGTTGLGEYINFVQKRAIKGKEFDEMALADTWRKAADVYRSLATKEANIAHNPVVLPLPKKIQPHLDKLTKHKGFAASFNNIPVCFGMVELDKLIMSQFHITTSTVNSLAEHLGKYPSISELVKTCLPIEPTKAKFDVIKEGKDGFIFQSDSHDLRFLGAKLLDSKIASNLDIHGYPAAVIGLAIGYSSNALNVVRYNNRMVLNNGYHRAYTLRSLGITHAPCVIQVCSHLEEVAMAGASHIYDNCDLFFNSARPPILKDYFNPKLTARYKAYKELRQIQLKYASESYKVKK